jgi:hypothetical protein
LPAPTAPSRLALRSRAKLPSILRIGKKLLWQDARVAYRNGQQVLRIHHVVHIVVLAIATHALGTPKDTPAEHL